MTILKHLLACTLLTGVAFAEGLPIDLPAPESVASVDPGPTPLASLDIDLPAPTAALDANSDEVAFSEALGEDGLPLETQDAFFGRRGFGFGFGGFGYRRCGFGFHPGFRFGGVFGGGYHFASPYACFGVTRYRPYLPYYSCGHWGIGYNAPLYRPYANSIAFASNPLPHSPYNFLPGYGRNFYHSPGFYSPVNVYRPWNYRLTGSYGRLYYNGCF